PPTPSAARHVGRPLKDSSVRGRRIRDRLRDDDDVCGTRGRQFSDECQVSVGSPHDIAPRSHQNEPVVAMDAHDPNVLVAGSNDYIDQQPCPQDIATQIAQCDDFSAGIGLTGVYFSFDRGKSWVQPNYTGWQASDCGTATV